jgi:hypothetical protein
MITIFWIVTPCSLAQFRPRFVERMTSIFRVKQRAKRETSKKQAASRLAASYI